MRNILFLILTVFCVNFGLYSSESVYPDHYSFTLYEKVDKSRKEYVFQEYDQPLTPDSYLGCVTKIKIGETKKYNLWDKKNSIKARAISHITHYSSPNFIQSGDFKIDLTDRYDYFFGSIKIQKNVEGGINVSIFDEKNECVGVSYIKGKGNRYDIFDPYNEEYKIGKITKDIDLDDNECWHVFVGDAEAIDSRTIVILVTFIDDNHSVLFK